MAIYSCNLSSVGRTTHAPGTAGAHLRYVSREGAEPTVEAHVIPLDAIFARTWMDREEATSRANARLIDKVRIAIPRELSRDERQTLVRDFVRDLTGDRVPWLFAIHQDGEDEHNPHAHIVLRDRDLESGKRVLRLSDSSRDREKAGLVPKAVEWVRECWEGHANLALERAGHDARIDRRTLKAQGIEREPTIHIGPQGQHVDEHVHCATSKKRTNGIGREVDYQQIDRGRTRKDRHAEIVDLNLERASRSPDVETRLRAKFEREQSRLDRQLEAALASQARDRTREERALKGDFRARHDALRAQRKEEHRRLALEQRNALRAKVVELRARQREERIELRHRQSSLWSRFRRAVDWTGSARRHQLDRRREQIAGHKIERHELAIHSHRERAALRDDVAVRYAPREDELSERRNSALAAMRELHFRGENQAEAKRQLREAARERERVKLEEAIRLAKQHSRAVSAPQMGGTGTGDGPTREAFREARQCAERRDLQPRRTHRDGPELGR